jgi:hypothetical protein
MNVPFARSQRIALRRFQRFVDVGAARRGEQWRNAPQQAWITYHCPGQVESRFIGRKRFLPENQKQFLAV